MKGVLQGAGLIARGRKRGQHRKRPPRRPLPGMLLQQVIPALVLKPAVLTGLTPKAGEAVDPVTQVGRTLRELGIQMIPAYSPQARGRSERNFSTWQGRLPQELRLAGCTTLEAANRFLREHYIAEFNRRFQVKPEQAGSAFVPCRKADLDDIFCLQWQRAVNRDNTVSFENLHLQIEPVRWRSFLGRLHGDGASTSGWDVESALWTALSGSLR